MKEQDAVRGGRGDVFLHAFETNSSSLQLLNALDQVFKGAPESIQLKGWLVQKTTVTDLVDLVGTELSQRQAVQQPDFLSIGIKLKIGAIVTVKLQPQHVFYNVRFVLVRLR